MVILTRFPDFLTLPSRSVPAPSSLPMSTRFFLAPLYCIVDVRDMTVRPLTLESVDIISSVMPSAKYSSFGVVGNVDQWEDRYPVTILFPDRIHPRRLPWQFQVIGVSWERDVLQSLGAELQEPVGNLVVHWS